MSDPADGPGGASLRQGEDRGDPLPVLTLAAEEVVVTRRVRRTRVAASRTTTTLDQVVRAELRHDRVVVERVPVNRVVDAVPPIREEDGVTIVPVVEEELVVVRRLVLREEVHLRREQATVPHTETVTLRRQHVSVTRTALDD